ncbi:MAG: diacylglycerol kinase family protein [Actinomycetota bacterium]|nr:diacylglycerol kinase family lipid kinase [Actinomycetota bacterium]
MTSPYGRLFVVLNPRAGRGAMERAWPRVERVLDEAGLDRDVVVTEHRGHAVEATRNAVENGATFVVAVGGDGTIHEVVNGMMADEKPLNPDAVLGVVPAGTGSDFIKTFGIPADPAEAAKHLAGDHLWGRLDVGRVVCRGAHGDDVSRWFANVGEAGLGAEVVRRAAKLPRRLGGNVYRLAALQEIIPMRPAEGRIEMHGRKARGVRVDTPLAPLVYEGAFDLLVVANCQFFGGGMKVAPRAIPEDDMLDVLVAHVNRREAVKLLKKMYGGNHVPSPKVAEYLASRISVTTSRAMTVEVDGEVIGSTPAVFDVVAAAIPFKV